MTTFVPNLSPGSAVVWESTKCRAMGMEKKQERANSCHHTRAPSSGKLVKTYFLQMQKEMSKSLWMQKGWVKVLRYMHEL
jgi:hypothetical protein